MFTGMHLIAGNWVSGETQFTSQPAHGETRSFAAGTRGNVDAAVEAAEEAFGTYGWSERTARARFLQCIAAQIDSRGDEITEIGTQETALPADRLVGERGRTVGQLRLFASHIEDGAYLDRRFEPAPPGPQAAAATGSAIDPAPRRTRRRVWRFQLPASFLRCGR